MRQIAAILLVLVNLISSGLVEFAIDSCCENDEINCCLPADENKKTNSSEQVVANGCCCTESENHFYYFTAKFQNTEKQENIKSTLLIDFTNHRQQLALIDFGRFPKCSNKFLVQHRLRKKVPPSLLVQYDVWVI